MSGHFNELTPEQAELLTLLAEECAEVVQSVTKILRHGMYSHHPADPSRTNQTLLNREVGQVLAAIAMLKSIGVLETAALEQAHASKLATVQQYLHHHTPRGLSLDEVVMKHAPAMILDFHARTQQHFQSGGYSKTGQEEAPHVFPVPPSVADMVICDSYGCQNMKRRDAVFCPDCAEEYKLDPDAFK